jgi:GDP/UDP-N,N'-diacetylbacillosamine 2-epimerase (hydrolysing)
MSRNRAIAVVTGSRADFGLLESTMRAVEGHADLRLITIAAGLHWVTGTWRDVRDAGFKVNAKVRMQRKGVSGRSADVQAMGRGVQAFGDAFDELHPDVVLVLGDRIEAMAAALAASVGGVHLAHVHGGDRAEGVADEAMRHAISKLAHLHFPATELSRKRLLAMGEQPQHVILAGSPAIDGLRRVRPHGKPPTFVVIQHPIGESSDRERRWMDQTLEAVDSAMRDIEPSGWRLTLAPNRDPGSRGIEVAVAGQCVEHLPREQFLACLAGARAIVGNSSAGLIEAAALRVPCVNIGPRQNGREKPANVVDCDYGVRSVLLAIRKATALDLRKMHHPYGDGRAGKRIAQTLAAIDLAAVPIRKQNTLDFEPTTGPGWSGRLAAAS